MKLSTILKAKGGDVISVVPGTRIRDVVTLLADKRIGAVVVCDEDHRLRGILSERDIVRTLAARSAATFDMTAEEIMTRCPKVATPHTTVAAAMEMMTEGRFRHLPIMEHDRLIGIVSIGDVVKARMSQQEMEVDSLRAYVAGDVN